MLKKLYWIPIRFGILTVAVFGIDAAKRYIQRIDVKAYDQKYEKARAQWEVALEKIEALWSEIVERAADLTLSERHAYAYEIRKPIIQLIRTGEKMQKIQSVQRFLVKMQPMPASPPPPVNDT